jgi:hypothetical protein
VPGSRLTTCRQCAGRSWHPRCFTCTDCNRKLANGEALDHDANPYCKKCHQVKYGNASVGNTGIESDREAVRASIDLRTTRPDFADPLKGKPAGTRTGAAESVVKQDSATEAQMQADRNRRALQAAERAFHDDQRDGGAENDSMDFGDDDDGPSMPSSLSGAKGKAYAAPKVAVGGGQGCRKCGKPVGFAEKVTALGGVYHKGTCFACSKCLKAFASSGEALEGAGEPCCKFCYNKHFGKAF